MAAVGAEHVAIIPQCAECLKVWLPGDEERDFVEGFQARLEPAFAEEQDLLRHLAIAAEPVKKK